MPNEIAQSQRDDAILQLAWAIRCYAKDVQPSGFSKEAVDMAREITDRPCSPPTNSQLERLFEIYRREVAP